MDLIKSGSYTDIFYAKTCATTKIRTVAGYHIVLATLLFLFNIDPSENAKYHKFPKYSDTQKICCNHSKIWTMWLYHRVMSPNDADGMANSVDPDQTAPLGAVWSGSALFAQAYLSENLGSLRYGHFGRNCLK